MQSNDLRKFYPTVLYESGEIMSSHPVFVYKAPGINKCIQTFPVNIRCSGALSSSSGAVGGLVKSVTDFIRPAFACLSGDLTLFIFKPPPLISRLPLPPRHPSAATWWTSDELLAGSASSSLICLSWILSVCIWWWPDTVASFFLFFLLHQAMWAFLNRSVSS